MSQTTWFAKIERNRGNWHGEASRREEISQSFLPDVGESYLSPKKGNSWLPFTPGKTSASAVMFL